MKFSKKALSILLLGSTLFTSGITPVFAANPPGGSSVPEVSSRVLTPNSFVECYEDIFFMRPAWSKLLSRRERLKSDDGLKVRPLFSNDSVSICVPDLADDIKMCIPGFTTPAEMTRFNRVELDSLIVNLRDLDRILYSDLRDYLRRGPAMGFNDRTIDSYLEHCENWDRQDRAEVNYLSKWLKLLADNFSICDVQTGKIVGFPEDLKPDDIKTLYRKMFDWMEEAKYISSRFFERGLREIDGGDSDF